MTKKKWLEINTDLLFEYKALEDLNSDNWDIASYLNLKYDVNAALAFSKLYFPDFIEKDGCVILAFLYNEQVFKEWFNHFKGHIPSIEAMCNTYDVMDYFSLNRQSNQSLDSYDDLIQEFAKVLKRSWEANFLLLFPNRKIVIDINDEDDTTRITLFSHEDNR